MNKLLMLSLILLGLNVNAKMECSSSTSSDQIEEQTEIKTDVPKHLEGATITVTLKDGRTTTVPAEKFKVVPRKQQFIVTKVSRNSTSLCTTNETQHHRVSVLAGKGTQAGIDVSRKNAPNEVTVENNVGAVLGAQYQYKTDLKVLDMPVSVGIQGQNNETGSVLLGLDF